MAVTDQRITVLIVETQTLVRAAFRLLIESWGVRVVGDTGNDVQAVALAKENRPDVIVMELDLRMDRSGLDLMSELLRVSNARILILTQTLDVELHHLAIRYGARGLVLKDHHPEQLRSAILKVSMGEVWLDDRLTTSIITRLAQSNRGSHDNKQVGELNRLSTRERELARLAGDGLSNKEIASRLFISETTVRHHLTSVFRKLGIANRLELIILTLRPGGKKPAASSTSVLHAEHTGQKRRSENPPEPPEPPTGRAKKAVGE
ncbi:MAG: response regulator transcription factor [Acidobacteriota bacterium]